MRAGNFEDLVLGLVASWVAAFGKQLNARLAPPVIEPIGRRSVVERRVETFGLPWPLRAPDGV